MKEKPSRGTDYKQTSIIIPKVPNNWKIGRTTEERRYSWALFRLLQACLSNYSHVSLVKAQYVEERARYESSTVYDELCISDVIIEMQDALDCAIYCRQLMASYTSVYIGCE